ncbi:MAG: sigma-70 family RNA polymerase sigma factor [Bacteroidales bacterium]|nr:sigma-70 family RNA polymerase sigma factor [Bacteroidales bacterium]
MKQTAAAILHDDDLANDAVQDTFVRLWRMRWRLGLMKDPQGYSIRTLRNLCIDMLRREKQRQKDLEAAATEMHIRQYDEDTDKAEQRFRQVEKAITALPQQQQQIIEMKYIKQLSIRKIAQQTGLSETNITTQLSRAYASLRDNLQNTINEQ